MDQMGISMSPGFLDIPSLNIRLPALGADYSFEASACAEEAFLVSAKEMKLVTLTPKGKVGKFKNPYVVASEACPPELLVAEGPARVKTERYRFTYAAEVEKTISRSQQWNLW